MSATGGVATGGVATAGATATAGASGTDRCPADPDKTAPGLCGCGRPDSDTDGDGTADCNDVCPRNATLASPGAFTISVHFTEGAEAYSQYFTDIERCLVYAGRQWATHFPVPHDVSIEVDVDILDIATASGKSLGTVYAETLSGFSLYHMSVPYEILTGIDPNGSANDALIRFGIERLTGASGVFYWFDPEPNTRTAAIPSNGFIGWRDWVTGALPGTYASYYDYLTATDGFDFYFGGARANATYGAPVPETYGNLMHVGNEAPRPGSDLTLDLMRGVTNTTGRRYSIGELDVAMLSDMGLPVPNSQAIDDICKVDTALAAMRRFAITRGPEPPNVE
jgi:hypothetical protein